MAPLSVFLSAFPADNEFAQRLAQVIAATGTPVVTELPTVGHGPGPDESKAPALVLVLSTAALASPAQGAAVQLYEALLQADPSIPVIPVLLDPLPADAVPPALGGFQPVTAPYGMPGFHEALIDGVLQRLGLAQQPGALTPVLPLPLPIGPASAPGSPAFAGAASDALPADALAADEPAPSAPLERATTTVVPVPVLPVPEMPTMPIMPMMPAMVTPAVVPPVPPRALTWRQRIERNRRPIAIGIAASLVLLLIACVAFSLGVGSPGNGAADRLDSGVLGGSHGAAPTETATASPSPAPTASSTHAKPTATTVHATPTGTHTAATATPTTTLPTPTPTPLGPGTGLHGDYFHSTTYHPGTPVPYPDPIFGLPWFSRTDTIIDMGYGQQSRTYTPPIAPFDSQVCPSPPTSSPCSPFAVRWTGFVRPRYTETYTFTTDSDDGVKLWINGQLVVDNWKVQGDTPASGTTSAALTAGQLYPITIEYYENGEGPATMVLQWGSASQAQAPEVIPQSQLYPPS